MFPKLRVPGAKFDKQKNVSFTESIAKHKSVVPSPDKYVTVNDWKQAVPGNKGRFLKSQRLLIAQEIINDKHKTPGPGSFTNEPKRKVGGCYTGKEHKVCNFIETANWHSMQSQSPKYDAKVKLTKPKIMETTIYKAKKPRFDKIEKKNEPAPGDYNVESAITKNRWYTTHANCFEKSKRATFTDGVAGMTKFVPGVGNYKYTEAAYSKLSAKVGSSSPRRH